MFQNYSENVSGKNEINNLSVIRQIVKYFFTIPNIIIYIITLLISSVSIRQNLMPFGLAIVAACIGSNIPIICVYFFALIGTFIGGGSRELGNFLAVSILYICFVLLFKSKVATEERNELLKTGGKLFFSCLLVEIIKNIKCGFLLYDFTIGLIYSLIVYIFYKIFVNGIAVIKEYNVKKVFTIEEIVASSIIIAVASIVFKNTYFMGISIFHVITILIIMILGWKNGVFVGATAGTMIGLVVSFSSSSSFMEIIMCAVSGVFAGIFSKLGKVGVITGFILGNVILLYITNGNALLVSYFREIFVASLGLLFMPKNLKLSAEDLFTSPKMLVGTDRMLVEKNRIIEKKLKAIKEVFSNEIENELDSSKDFEDFKKMLENSLNQNFFYNELFNDTKSITSQIYQKVCADDYIQNEDIINIFERNNVFFDLNNAKFTESFGELCKAINKSYRIIEQSRNAKIEESKVKKIVVNNIKEAEKILDNISNIPEEKDFAFKEKEVYLLLNRKDIKIKNCIINQAENGKFTVKINSGNSDMSNENIKYIEKILSKSLNEIIIVQSKNEGTYVFESKDNFLIQVGTSKITKENSEISGDCTLQTKLSDGKFLFAIADGMGSGVEARKSSKLVLKTVKELLVNGFSEEETIKMVNASLNIYKEKETYSTLDAIIIDLYSGQADTLKNGACDTCVINGDKITKIKNDSFPIGISNEIKLDIHKIKINHGDIIVMYSDGLFNEKIDQSWIERFVIENREENIQKLSDLMLAHMVEKCSGKIEDDISIIICKII